ncbi:MAG: hypothetical protein K2X66_04210, partial [Cyanobacteria bacterium]|nr:hypothetical protein [Cyanobacteriota bacterium]
MFVLGMFGFAGAEAREKIKPLPFTHEIPPTYLNFQGKALGVLSSPEPSFLEKHIQEKNHQPGLHLDNPAQCLIFFTQPESALAQKCWVSSKKDSNAVMSNATQVPSTKTPSSEKGLGYLYLPENDSLENPRENFGVDSNSKV